MAVSDSKPVSLPRHNLRQQTLKILEVIQKKKLLFYSDAVDFMIVTARGAACLRSCLEHLVKWAWVSIAGVFMPTRSPTFSPVPSVPDLPPCLPGFCWLRIEDGENLRICRRVAVGYSYSSPIHVLCKPQRPEFLFATWKSSGLRCFKL